MRIAIGLIMLLALWGCASEPPLTESGKPAVEERTPAPSAAAKPGPATAPVKPAPGVAPKPVPATPPRAQVSPLKDPSSPLSKRSVFYEYDSDAIRDEYRPLIQAHAKYLADNPGTKMLIQGHCDERGSREYNIALGQRRADALKRMLALLGAREAQIDTVSLGEEKPRCNEATEGCYQQNRRSDMLYSGEF